MGHSSSTHNRSAWDRADVHANRRLEILAWFLLKRRHPGESRDPPIHVTHLSGEVRIWLSMGPGFHRDDAGVELIASKPASMIIPRYALGLGDFLVFDRRLEHHALGQLIDIGAEDFLPWRLAFGHMIAA